MTDFLDLEAYLRGDFLHPGGPMATEVLLRKLDLQVGEIVLELGCGTGATAARVARGLGTRVIGLDRSPAMLAVAQQRLRDGRLSSVSLVRVDLGRVLPFPGGIFDALYAESVVALLELESVIAECTRVLRPGGRLGFIERIWKPGVSQVLGDEVNAASQQLFGIPAATRQPFDRADWLRILRQAGLGQVRAIPVDELIPLESPKLHVRRRLSRGRRYLTRPQVLRDSFRFKLAMRKHEALWLHLESYMFLGRKR